MSLAKVTYLAKIAKHLSDFSALLLFIPDAKFSKTKFLSNTQNGGFQNLFVIFWENIGNKEPAGREIDGRRQTPANRGIREHSGTKKKEVTQRITS